MSSHRDRDTGLELLILIIGIGAAILLFWYLFKDDIAWFALVVSKLNYNLLESLHDMGGFGKTVIWCLYPERFLSSQSLIELQTLYRATDPANMTDADIYAHFNFAGYFTRWPVLILGILSLVSIFKSGKVQRQKRRFKNIIELFEYSKETFPHLKPALSQNLLEKNPDVGPYRREDSPIRFAIKNGLIRAYKLKRKGVIKGPSEEVSLNKKDGYYFLKDDLTNHLSKIHDLCEFNHVKAKKVFTKQLGKKFTTVDAFSIERRAILAVFIAFYCPDIGKERAFELLKQFNHSWDYKKIHDDDGNYIDDPSDDFIDTDGIDEIINTGMKNEFVLKVISSHAYEDTVLCGLLQLARSKGKLWSAFWYWLLPVNRKLYWVLDAIGGHTCWTEGAAVFSHFTAELKSEHALSIPFIEPAVEGLHFYLDESEGWIMSDKSRELYFPTQDEEY